MLHTVLVLSYSWQAGKGHKYDDNDDYDDDIKLLIFFISGRTGRNRFIYLSMDPSFIYNQQTC